MGGPVVLTPEDYRSMPWKNGQGTTVEIAVEPPDAAVGAGFLWRLSIATVGASGPFSAFPGYDRTIMLLDGAGMTLDFGAEGRADLTRRWHPVAFSGDWQTSADLVDGAVRDFNVMTRRASATHSARVIDASTSDGAIQTADVRQRTFLFYGLNGVSTVVSGETLTTLPAGHTLRIDCPKALDTPLGWLKNSSPSTFYLVEIAFS